MKFRTTGICVAALIILAVQGIASYSLRREPFLPSPPPLFAFPLRIENWAAVGELPVDPAALEMLGPDDTLNRAYQAAAGADSQAALFVAYYKTQLRAKQAHDPKVCLPGNGWNPVASRVVTIGTGRDAFSANYYRISKPNQEAVVIYWFQTHKAVYTLEQQLRAHRLLDAIIDNRTDMALVRLMVPVGPNGVAAADHDAISLSKLIYPRMLPYFPASSQPSR